MQPMIRGTLIRLVSLSLMISTLSVQSFRLNPTIPRVSVIADAQKSASSAKAVKGSEVPAITPAFWYSPTRFSKKLVLPCKEISSIQSKGFSEPKILLWPKAVNSRSATNSQCTESSGLCSCRSNHKTELHK